MSTISNTERSEKFLPVPLVTDSRHFTSHHPGARDDNIVLLGIPLNEVQAVHHQHSSASVRPLLVQSLKDPRQDKLIVRGYPRPGTIASASWAGLRSKGQDRSYMEHGA